MTALTRFQRLECPGLWRENPSAQLREVIVSFGDASLILSDSKSAVALTHWSLPAVERVNPGGTPARFSPDPERAETLELDDDTMIGAIDQIRRAIESQRPHPGRLRGAMLTGGLLLVLAIVLFLLPAVLVRHTAGALPQSTREEIGEMVLADMSRITGKVCSTPNGDRALARLWTRLSGNAEGGVRILPTGFAASTHLPGGLVLLQRDVIEKPDTAEVAAGYILAEGLRAESRDPLIPVLRHAGLAATFRLLTTGALPPESVRGYAEKLLTAPVTELEDDALLARFAAAGVPSSPYAYAADRTGESTLRLIEADPFRGRRAQTPVLSDPDWVSLQGICVE